MTENVSRVQRQQIDEPLSIGSYLGMLILNAIPVVGFICLLCWAFGSKNRNRRNFAWATLIFSLIGTICVALLYAAFGAALGTLFSAISM